ncbi:MAG TPA: nitronate monooxygenase [Jatrophihabitans sp.]|jgi:nitronate monooxygenase|uniref:nitronate monooxygenase n=1 Tax=Jatrophihabitans sp. TaxID=1932789 RepID=UPI002DFF0056|nr:nitronate monooxygenase [Jatrophihabitans sp.]
MTLPSALPIVQAPMAGGPSTPELAAAVAAAGGYPGIAAGYLTPAALHDALRRTRALTGAPLGVNLFCAGPDHADADAIARYAAGLAGESARLAVPLGAPRWDDDQVAEKVEVVANSQAHLAGFTFGCPAPGTVERLQRAGVLVAVTVTSAEEAATATDAGADALIVQGTEAGGHQAVFDSATPNRTPLLDALAAVRGATTLPLIAAGGIATGAELAAVLAAGAVAGQIGTALLLAPEAGTSLPHRAALETARYAGTTLTRAFSGRWARGLANRFALEHEDAPDGYPQIHHLTRPLRAAATAAGDSDVPNLWAGTNWRLAEARPAGEIVRRLADDARRLG